MNVSRKVNKTMIDMLKNFDETSSPRCFLDKYEYCPVNSNGDEENIKKQVFLEKEDLEMSTKFSIWKHMIIMQ